MVHLSCPASVTKAASQTDTLMDRLAHLAWPVKAFAFMVRGIRTRSSFQLTTVLQDILPLHADKDREEWHEDWECVHPAEEDELIYEFRFLCK